MKKYVVIILIIDRYVGYDNEAHETYAEAVSAAKKAMKDSLLPTALDYRILTIDIGATP